MTRDALRAWRGEAARARLRGQLAGLLGWPKMLKQRRATLRKAAPRVSNQYIEELLESSTPE